jgi:hypothetical protein
MGQRKNNDTKNWYLYFEVINIDNTMARLIRKKRYKTFLSNIKNEKDNMTIDAISIKRITKKYYVDRYYNKLITWVK